MDAQRTTPGTATVGAVGTTPAAGPIASQLLQVRLLGELDLRLGRSPLAPLESARAESLLAYLLLHRDAPQPRQRLAFLLWPDSSERQARTNLRHVLYKLRRGLPDADRFIDATARTLQWNPDAPFHLDVASFEEALARAGRAADGGLAALRQAVDAYGGDLLDALYDDWVLDERERLRQRYLDALERLVRLLEERGEHAQAVPYAERLLRHDPLREETYRLLMRLHDARGDRARALRVFHACTAALERELGVGPSAATRELYEALLPLDHDAAADGSHAARRGGAVLVGRASERARLTEVWRSAERGRAQLVLVTGEPGIGKTRLVEELRSWCAHRGAVTAEARSYPAEGMLLFGPVAAWLRSEPLAARRGRLDSGRLSELARILPEVLDTPGVPRPAHLPAGEHRQRLFDALVRALLVPGTPLLLVADDLHWADRETLQFLHYLLRTEPEAQLLVAATARREETDREHGLSELVAGLQALERLSEIELARLSRQETAVLAERFAGGPLQEPDAERLFVETEGNPLFVVEALRAGWTGGTGGRAPLTPKVQAVIESRLAQLSRPAHDLVGIAAAVGREFTTDVLAEASECDEAGLVQGLDELWRRGIVRDRGPDAYDFTHDRIREVAYRGLTPARRRDTHLRVARALERLHAGDPASLSGRVAVHYDRAGAADSAVSWYERAIEASQRLHGNAEAVTLAERALELLRTLPANADRDARELALLTAALAPLAIVEGFASTRLEEVQRRGLQLARALQVEAGPPLVRSLALVALSRSDFEASRRFGNELRSRGERDGDDVLLVESDYVLGVSAFWQGELRSARRHFEAAVKRYRPEHRPTHLARYGLDPRVVCLSRLANTLWFLGRPEAATRARDSALSLAADVGHRPSASTALVFAALLSLDLRDEERVRHYTRALRESHRDDDARVVDVSMEGLAGYVDVLDGRSDAGLARMRRALDDAREAEHAPGLHASIMRLLLEGFAVVGDARGGLAAAGTALGARAGARLWEAETRRLRAEFLAALGAPEEEVEAELELALEAAGRQGARALELRVATSLLRRRLEAGDDRRAAQAGELVAAALDALPEGATTRDRSDAEEMLVRR